MKRISHNSPLVLFFAVLLFGTSLLYSTTSPAAESGAPDSTASAEEMMAGLSDEQVRQMLLDELKLEAEMDAPAIDRMKGPAFVLSRLLRGLSSEHDENEDQLKDLFGQIPNVLPDLYKVFIKL